MGDLADRLERQGKVLSGLWRSHSTGKLLESKRAQDDAHLLNTPSQ